MQASTTLTLRQDAITKPKVCSTFLIYLSVEINRHWCPVSVLSYMILVEQLLYNGLL